MSLADRFASLFSDKNARQLLSELGEHTRLPTFNLATTSLRHINKWFDRLDSISRGISSTHGNYFSDPGSIGLVETERSPKTLTRPGRAFLALKDSLQNNPSAAEYQLIKLLCFDGYSFNSSITEFLELKREHLKRVLERFAPSPSRHQFIEFPRLLVIAELISGFPGAIPGLVRLGEE